MSIFFNPRFYLNAALISASLTSVTYAAQNVSDGTNLQAALQNNGITNINLLYDPSGFVLPGATTQLNTKNISTATSDAYSIRSTPISTYNLAADTIANPALKLNITNGVGIHHIDFNDALVPVGEFSTIAVNNGSLVFGTAETSSNLNLTNSSKTKLQATNSTVNFFANGSINSVIVNESARVDFLQPRINTPINRFEISGSGPNTNLTGINQNGAQNGLILNGGTIKIPVGLSLHAENLYVGSPSTLEVEVSNNIAAPFYGTILEIGAGSTLPTNNLILKIIANFPNSGVNYGNEGDQIGTDIPFLNRYDASTDIGQYLPGNSALGGEISGSFPVIVNGDYDNQKTIKWRTLYDGTKFVIRLINGGTYTPPPSNPTPSQAAQNNTNALISSDVEFNIQANQNTSNQPITITVGNIICTPSFLAQHDVSYSEFTSLQTLTNTSSFTHMIGEAQAKKPYTLKRTNALDNLEKDYTTSMPNFVIPGQNGSFFANGGYSHTDIKGKNGGLGSKSYGGNISFGMDFKAEKYLSVGVIVGNIYSSMHVDQNGGRSHLSRPNASFFGNLSLGHLNFNALINYGRTFINNKRFTSGLVAESSHHQSNYLGSLKASYTNIIDNNWILTPSMSFYGSRLLQDAYSEHGTDPAKQFYAGQTSTSVGGDAGIEVNKISNIQGTMVSTKLSVSYNWDKIAKGSDQNYRLIDSTTLISTTAKKFNQRIRAGVGIGAKLNSRWDLQAGYTVNKGRTVLVQEVMIGVKRAL